MSTITISLTKQNLKLLIDHVYIGNWILNAHKIDRDIQNDNFFDTIMSIGKNYNITEGIEYIEEIDRFDFSKEKADLIHELIDEHDEDTFWELLVEKLASRDLFEKNTTEKIQAMDKIEYLKAIWREEEKYNDEFETHGIDRLRIKK